MGRGSVGARLVVVGLLIGLLGGCSTAAPGTSAATGTGAPPAPASATANPTPKATQPRSDPLSGLPTIAVADLPAEAVPVLADIATGDPFAYSQDGVVFNNREGILPRRTSGYYHEYTVPTPGSPDRGARRLVAGKGSEIYYTADHYASFWRVWP